MDGVAVYNSKTTDEIVKECSFLQWVLEVPPLLRKTIIFENIYSVLIHQILLSLVGDDNYEDSSEDNMLFDATNNGTIYISLWINNDIFYFAYDCLNQFC